MLCTIQSATVLGLTGLPIAVEVDVAERGFPTFTIVGLPNKAVEEAKERVRTAIKNSSFPMPETRIVVNLAPADIPKSGSLFDLPIAIGILASSRYIHIKKHAASIFIGELSLDGTISPVSGVLPIILYAKRQGIKTIFIPYQNKKEAEVVKGIEVYAVSSLSQLILHLNEESFILPLEKKPFSFLEHYEYDFSLIKGQYQAKRALEISAAGFHNVYLSGPPGAGKTLLAKSFPSILPPMDDEEALEVAQIYSIYNGHTSHLITQRPYRSPHHTTSRAGLIGGGNNLSPGEISLAHRGVLFLDELPEFPRSLIESLRQPLEDGIITISRAQGNITYPARFIFFAASNPCPCGYLGHFKRSCTCTPWQILKYKKRVSGPVLDRIDLCVTVSPVDQTELISSSFDTESKVIRERVRKARDIQLFRFKEVNVKFNAEMSVSDLKKFTHLSKNAQMLLSQATTHLSLSARSYFKIMKIAQTIADLNVQETVEADHIAEALQFRFYE